MKVLVLGGNGFIGSHVVDKLLAAKYKVRVFDRSEEIYRSPLPGVDYRYGNFNDSFAVAEALHDIEIVIHLICSTVPATSNLDPEEDIKSNILSTIRLLENMRKKNIRRMVYLSSGGTVYGNVDENLVFEDHPLNPICSYGVVKLTVEKYLFMYQQLYGFVPTIIRPSNPYGPRQGRTGLQGLIGTFLNKIVAGDPIEIWGNGEIVRDHFFITDLAQAVLMAIERGATGIFNVGSGQGYSINQILLTLKEIQPFKFDVKYQEGREFDVQRVVLDISKAERTLAWQPKVSLREGIKKHMEWLQTQ